MPAELRRPPSRRAVLLSRAVLLRQAAAEFLGTGLLVAVIVGSGITASRLSPGDEGLQLLAASLATAFGLTAIIWVFGPLSGAHVNPVVTIVSRVLGDGRSTGATVAYVGAQITGAIAGCLLANAMFAEPTAFSTTERALPETVLGEVVATLGLVLVVFALLRADRPLLVAPAVGLYIGAAYWFTSSFGFANPAVTIGRVFSDTFAGIDPSSAAWFLAAQLVGGALGGVLVLVLYPTDQRRSPCPTPSHP